MTIQTACILAMIILISIEIFILARCGRFFNTEIAAGLVREVQVLMRNYVTEYVIIVRTRGTPANFNFRFTEHEFFHIFAESKALNLEEMDGLSCLLAIKGKRARFIMILPKGAICKSQFGQE